LIWINSAAEGSATLDRESMAKRRTFVFATVVTLGLGASARLS
jgi:hypothetical protein